MQLLLLESIQVVLYLWAFQTSSQNWLNDQLSIAYLFLKPLCKQGSYIYQSQALDDQPMV